MNKKYSPIDGMKYDVANILHNEEQCILEEWRATLKKLIKIQGELWRVRERLNEYYGQFVIKDQGGDQ